MREGCVVEVRRPLHQPPGSLSTSLLYLHIIINPKANCNCSGEVFNIRSGKHCCQDSCEGLGPYDETYKQWEGIADISTGFEHIGAKCNGKVRKLTEACRGVCNHHEGEKNQNTNGVNRNHIPCSSNTKTGVTQCILKTLENNGVYDCKNRHDETPFKEPDAVMAEFLDLRKWMVNCTGGFRCSGDPKVPKDPEDPEKGCLPWKLWCFAGEPFECSELNTTADDHRVCSSQSFWEDVPCALEEYEQFPSYRCTGNSSGSCWEGELSKGKLFSSDPGCPDDTHKIKKATEGGDCAVRCTARDGRWKGETICLDEKYICDNTLQCEEGEDEAPVRQSCRKEYVKKKIFLAGQTFPCPTHNLTINGSKIPFAPLRGIPCDRVPQCPLGEDENGCDLGSQAIVILGKNTLMMISNG